MNRVLLTGWLFACGLTFSQSASADAEQETFQNCADGFNSQDCNHINEANDRFFAIEQRLQQVQPTSFNLIIEDRVTNEQVGIFPGTWIFKVDRFDGTSAFWRGYPGSLPEVDVQVTTHTKVLNEVTAFLRCDGTMLTWHANYDWPGTSRSWNIGLPSESYSTNGSNYFGTATNGDVLLARTEEEHSTTWDGDYHGVFTIDDSVNWGDPRNELHVESDEVLDCIIEIQRYAFPPNWPYKLDFDGDESSFTISESTVISDFAAHWHYDNEELEIRTRMYITYEDGRLTEEQIRELCGLWPSVGECTSWVNSWGEMRYPIRKNYQKTSGIRKVTATEIHGIKSVSSIGEVPGNRGEPRSFGVVWR